MVHHVLLLSTNVLNIKNTPSFDHLLSFLRLSGIKSGLVFLPSLSHSDTSTTLSLLEHVMCILSAFYISGHYWIIHGMRVCMYTWSVEDKEMQYMIV